METKTLVTANCPKYPVFELKNGKLKQFKNQPEFPNKLFSKNIEQDIIKFFDIQENSIFALGLTKNSKFLSASKVTEIFKDLFKVNDQVFNKNKELNILRQNCSPFIIYLKVPENYNENIKNFATSFKSDDVEKIKTLKKAWELEFPNSLTFIL